MKHLFLTLLVTATLSGCSSLPKDTYQDIYPYRVNMDVAHEMMILNSGIASLKMRLDMITRAERSIELEYFIFNPDRAGRLVLQALVKKVREKREAGEAFSVRILVDKAIGVFELDEFYAKALKEAGIELRYYNPAPVIAISTVQFRNHRKVIIIDGVEVVTGGRNIADEYFDLSEEFNFLDRDIWVKGEIVGAIVETFNRFWSSKIVEIPVDIRQTDPGDPPEFIDSGVHTERMRYQEKLDLARDVLVHNDKDQELLQSVHSLGGEILQKKSSSLCPHVGFASDKEGASFVKRLNSPKYQREYRLLRQELAERIQNVESKLTVESPYIILNKRSLKTLIRLLEDENNVTVLTNSLGSTDAFLISSVFNFQVKRWVIDDRFNAYVYSGQWSQETPLISKGVENAAWGIHSKSFVIDEDKIIVGTYNIDNRSSFYNAEMAIFCDGNKALADEIMANIHKRMEKSYRLNEQGVPEDGAHILRGSSATKKLFYYLFGIPALMFKFLL